MNLTKWMGVALLTTCALAANAEIRYKAVSMGRPAGMEKDVFHIWSAHLNDKGDAAGFLQARGISPFAYDAPFLYRDGKMTIPQILGKNFQHDVHGFNNHGVAVGAGLQYNVPERYIPLVWEGNSMRILPSERSAVARGISDTGTIVGYEFESNNLGIKAVQWVNGIKSNLVTPGSPTSITFGISSNGQFIVGSAGDKAVYWENGIMKNIPGDRAIRAYSASNDGRIVGEASGVGVSTVPFVSFGGVTTYLEKFGRKYATAGDVNGKGTIVGTGYDLDSNFNFQNWIPLLWENGAASNLNLITDKPSGVELQAVSSINERGQIAVRGERNGLYEMFVLTPVPEPSTFMIGMGVLGLLTRKKARSSAE